MRYNDASFRPRWRPAIALMLALWLAVVGAEWILPGGGESAHHGPHTMVAGLHGDFAVAVDHTHAQNDTGPAVPDTFAEAVLPRATVALIALALIASVVFMAPFWRQATRAADRGPPRSSAAPLSGRVLLTRLCIARR